MGCSIWVSNPGIFKPTVAGYSAPVQIGYSPETWGRGGGGTGTCSPQHLDTWPHPESGLQPLVLPPGREKPELQKAEQGWDRHQAKKPYGGGNRGFGESNSFKPEPSFYLKFIVMGSTQEGMKGREHAGDTGTR